MIIYQVSNNVNKKIYIGKTIRTLEQRKVQHYNDVLKGSQTHFHRALRKYDKANFTWSIIHQCKSEKELNETEIYFIDKLETMKNGYNMTIGGDGGPIMYGKDNPNYGKTFSKEHRKKMSLSKKGKYLGVENPFFGKHHTEETIKKIRYGNKGKQTGKDNPMIIHNIDFTGELNPFFGKHHSQRTKDIISETNSDIWLITTPDNKEFLFKSLRKFCQQNHLNYSGVKGAVHNKRKYKDGWFFKKLTWLLCKKYTTCPL